MRGFATGVGSKADIGALTTHLEPAGQSDLERDRDQLWGEAVKLEAEGHPIRLDPSLWGVAAVEQDLRTAQDPWDELFSILDNEPFKGLSLKVHTEHAWAAVGMDKGQRTQEYNVRLGNVLRDRGFENKMASFGGRKLRAYVRKVDGCAVVLEARYIDPHDNRNDHWYLVDGPGDRDDGRRTADIPF